MEKYYIFFISIILSASKDLQSLKSANCPRFDNSNQNPAFKQDESVCLVSQTTTNYTQYYARSCKNPYYCDQTTLTDNLAYCMPVSKIDPLNLQNGIKCNYNDDCESKICQSGICKKKTGLDCDETADCDGGFYCLSKICTPLINEGETGCETDDECAFGLGCRRIKVDESSFNSCTKFFSLENGEFLLPNGGGAVSFVCKSGWGYLNSTSNTGECIEAPKTEDYPKKCESDTDCSVDYGNGYSFTTRCDCGYNNEGEKYCVLNVGDSPYEDFLRKLKEWSENRMGAQCNALVMYDDDCVRSWWGTEDADEFIYYKARARLYHRLEGASTVILKVFEREYEEIKEAYDENDSGISIFSALAVFYLI